MASVPGPPVLYKSNPSQIHPHCTDQAIQFFWSPPDTDGGSAILSYTLECSSISFTQTYSETTFFTKVTGLTNGVDYTFTIKATNAIGDGPVATYRTVQTGLKPSVPINGVIFGTTSTTVTAIWDPPSSNGGALIKWYTLRAFSTTPGYSNVIACAYGTQNNTTLVGLNSNSTYNIFLDAVNDPGHSPLIKIMQPIKVVIGGGGTNNTTIPANKLLYSTNGGGYLQQSANGGTIFTNNSTVVHSGAWNGSVFAYIGYLSNSGFDIAYSSDGITWSKSVFDHTSIPNFVNTEVNIYDSQILVRNSIFYLYLSYATNSGSGDDVYHRTLYTSTDGNNWTFIDNVTGLETVSSIPIEVSKTISCMLIKTDGTILAFVYNPFDETSNALYSSSDGLTFTFVADTGLPGGGFTLGYNNQYWTLIYDGTYYYTVQSYSDSSTFQLCRSIDGLAWSTHGTPIPLASSARMIASDGAGNLVVVGVGNNNDLDSCFYSNNGGATWNGTGLGISSSPNFVSPNIYQVAWTGQYFVIATFYAYGTFGGRILYSSNGANWTVNYITGECGYPYPLIVTGLPTGKQILVSLIASYYSGTGDWLDTSVYEHNASIENGTAAKNVDGNGIILNGSTNWQFSNIGSQSIWSIVIWFKRTGASDTDAAIVTENFGVSETINMAVYASSATAFRGGFNDGNWRNGTTVTFPLNEWHQIAVTWNGTNIITYLDGIVDSTVNQSTYVSGSTDLNSYSIGKNWSTTDYVTGEIGEVTIFNYPLDSTDITRYYNQTVSTYLFLRISLNASTYSGTGTWNDDSGNGYNATIENGTAAKNTSGNGIILNGSTNWQFSNIGSQSIWSIVTWFKRTGASDTDAAIVTENFGVSETINMAIYASSATAFRGGFNDGNWRNGTAVTFPLNEWHQIAVTWNGTNIITYLDGSLDSTVDQSTYVSGSTDLNSYSIGKNWSTTDYVTGEIGELQIYNYPISSGDVSTYYITSYPKYGPLVSFFASTYSGTGDWLDNSPYENNAVLDAGTAAKNVDGNGIILDGTTRFQFGNVGSQGKWSIVLWFKRTVEFPIDAAIVGENFKGAGLPVNMAIYASSATEFVGGFYDGTAWITGTPVAFPVDEWHQITVTWDNTNIITYLDGSVSSTVDQSGNTSSSTIDLYNIAGTIEGEIGAIQIYGYPLTSTQVSSYYAATSSTYI